MTVVEREGGRERKGWRERQDKKEKRGRREIYRGKRETGTERDT